MRRLGEEHIFTTSLARVFPFRFLGMGVYLAWLLTIHYSTKAFGSPDLAMQSLVVSNLSNIAGLFAIVVLSRKVAPLCSHRSACVIAGISGFVGTMLASLVPMDVSFGMALFTFGNVLIGLATALLILMWNELLAGFLRREVGILCSASYMMSAAVYYFVGFLDEPVRLAFIAVLPICSVAMLVFSMRVLPDRREEIRESAESRWSFPWRPSLLLAVYAFVMAASRFLDFDSNNAGMLGMFFVALVVLLCNVFLFHRFDVRMLYKAAPPLMVAGVLLIVFFDGFSSLGNMLLNAGFSGFIILTVIVLSNISYQYGVTAIWLFGLTRVFRVAATVAAAYGYTAMSYWGFVGSSVIGALSIVLIVAASMFFLSDRDFANSWGINPLRVGDSTTVEGFYQSVEGKCSLLGRRFGLTPREQEVLVLLAQDRSISSIEEALVISNGTAKSHIRHIYAKIGVHSRKEVVQMVEEQR